ncbi:MAG TPA: PEP-CTERM sorting domain-containing protein [Chthoniobacteraceae bacterium]|nr:PEP-CTERM sorting domain-containing protein [Chthoniobacteraceae bacterium]
MITRTTPRVGKHVSRRIPSLLAGIAAFTLLPATLHSATVFEFGPSNAYVTKDEVNYRRTASMTESAPYISTVAFDGSTPLSPAEDYAGPVFYGGYTFSSSTYPQGFTGQRIINNYSNTGNNDAIYFNVVGPNNTDFRSTEMSFAAVFVFNQSSFNAPYQEGNVSIDGFSIRFYKHFHGATYTGFNPVGRWLVEIGGAYYLSDSTFIAPGTDQYLGFSLSGDDLQATRWAAYDPQSSLSFDAESATFDELALEQISAVGFHFEDPHFQTTVTGTLGMRLAVSEFGVTTIPEPGSLALLGMGLPCLAGYLAHRFRKTTR